jgi:hypothetical protein
MIRLLHVSLRELLFGNENTLLLDKHETILDGTLKDTSRSTLSSQLRPLVAIYLLYQPPIRPTALF